MELEKFKETVFIVLQALYKGEAEVFLEEIVKNGGVKYTGVFVHLKGKMCSATPIFCLEDYYKQYTEGKKTVDECISSIVEISEEHRRMLEVEELAERLCAWEQVKNEVYPVLLPIKGNQILLKSLVKRRWLDLAIVYVIRDSMSNEEQACIKISHSLFEKYGISKEELHEQAMKNLEEDNYAFLDLDQIALQLFAGTGKCEPVKKLRNGKTYMLRNCSGPFGAAGILNKKLLQEIVGNKNCYIFPSSVHETVFMPVERNVSRKVLDKLVEEINEDRELSELLSDHCYFYEGSCGELKMCA